MFSFSGAIKFYYCPTPISMRKSFDGLAGAVEEYIQQEPESIPLVQPKEVGSTVA